MTGPGDNSNAQIRSIVDRILRLKEEQDALATDIREVYAVAKANGFDKTGLGSLVSHLRRKEKNPEKEAERSAIFDLYLTAYEGGSEPKKLNDFSHAHTHDAQVQARDAREDETPAPPNPEVDDGQPQPSDPAGAEPVEASAKSEPDDAPSDAGQGTHFGHGEQENADEPQAGNEAGSGEAAPVTNSGEIDLTVPGFLRRNPDNTSFDAGEG